MSLSSKIVHSLTRRKLLRKYIVFSSTSHHYFSSRLFSSNGPQKGATNDFNEQQRRKSPNFYNSLILFGATATWFAVYSLVKRRRPQSENLSSSPGLSVDRGKGFLSSGKVFAAETFIPSDGTSRRDRFNFIAEVVEETAPALVYIQIKNLGVRDFYTGEALTTSNGSGFIVKEDGLILTNAHVVLNKPNSSVQVTLADGRTFVGVVEDADVGSDLATVRIKASGLPTMKLGNSSKIRPGEFVIAMGSPLSLTNTITTGVVSSPARNKSELRLQGRNVSEYIQTDAAITFGNSGGPLLNLNGEAIGINSMKLTPGISFAIPIDHAKDFLEKTEEKGTAKRRIPQRRFLGITMVALDPRVVQELQLRHQLPVNITQGILVFRMVQESPADKSGMRPGDIITQINGSAITSSKDIYQFLESTGDLRITIIRKGKVVNLDVNLDI